MGIYNFGLVLLGVFCYVIFSVILPPRNFPKNIPTIPFYVSFLGFFTRLDQRGIYELYLREKLESNGAVKIYFASRWNILVSRPKYLVEIFRKESIYAKSGNHIKIPYAVLSQYTGSNIISAHGNEWKLFRNIVANSIQFPDTKPVDANLKTLVDMIDKRVESCDSVNIGELFQRYCLQNVGQSILGLDLDAFTPDSKIHKKVINIKQKIFKPLYMNFPILDILPIPSRIKARLEVENFRNYYTSKLFTSYDNTTAAGKRLVDSYEDGTITEKQFQDNAIILMVAGHENPLLLILSIFYCIVKYPEMQCKIRSEIYQNQDFPYLDSFIYETLRLYPPLNQIVNRRTTRKTLLGHIKIPKDVYVGYHNYGTGRDKSVWGSDSDVFRPERWGSTLSETTMNYKKAKRSGTLPAFHGGSRACLGERFALYEVKALLIEIVRNYRLTLDMNWKDKFTPAGPLCPINLKIKFEKL
jgi:cytochrome P450